MATRPLPATDACHAGRHRAKRVPIREGATESVCLDCGCRLIRIAGQRRWIYAGLLA